MSEKEKRKHSEQKQAPFWLYSLFIFVLLITLPFPLFHILNAYPHVYEYQSISRINIRFLGFILALVLCAGAFMVGNQRHKYVIIFAAIIVSYSTLFHDGLGLMFVGFIVSPIALLSFSSLYSSTSNHTL